MEAVTLLRIFVVIMCIGIKCRVIAVNRVEISSFVVILLKCNLHSNMKNLFSNSNIIDLFDSLLSSIQLFIPFIQYLMK